MHRRVILLSAAAVPALAVMPGGAAAFDGHEAPIRQVFPLAAEPQEPRRLRLRHAATGARFSGTYHDGREPDPSAMAELSLVLADQPGDCSRPPPFDPAALDILWELGCRQGMDEFVILSGYRTVTTNRAVGGAGDSQHLHARALDVEVPSARLRTFGAAALALGRGGVGIYASRGFVHLDCGPVRHWWGNFRTAGDPQQPRPTDRVGRIANAWARARRR